MDNIYISDEDFTYNYYRFSQEYENPVESSSSKPKSSIIDVNFFSKHVPRDQVLQSLYKKKYMKSDQINDDESLIIAFSHIIEKNMETLILKGYCKGSSEEIDYNILKTLLQKCKNESSDIIKL